MKKRVETKNISSFLVIGFIAIFAIILIVVVLAIFSQNGVNKTSNENGLFSVTRSPLNLFSLFFNMKNRIYKPSEVVDAYGLIPCDDSGDCPTGQMCYPSTGGGHCYEKIYCTLVPGKRDPCEDYEYSRVSCTTHNGYEATLNTFYTYHCDTSDGTCKLDNPLDKIYGDCLPPTPACYKNPHDYDDVRCVECTSSSHCFSADTCYKDYCKNDHTCDSTGIPIPERGTDIGKCDETNPDEKMPHFCDGNGNCIECTQRSDCPEMTLFSHECRTEFIENNGWHQFFVKSYKDYDCTDKKCVPKIVNEPNPEDCGIMYEFLKSWCEYHSSDSWLSYDLLRNNLEPNQGGVFGAPFKEAFRCLIQRYYGEATLKARHNFCTSSPNDYGCKSSEPIYIKQQCMTTIAATTLKPCRKNDKDQLVMCTNGCIRDSDCGGGTGTGFCDNSWDPIEDSDDVPYFSTCVYEPPQTYGYVCSGTGANSGDSVECDARTQMCSSMCSSEPSSVEYCYLFSNYEELGVCDLSDVLNLDPVCYYCNNPEPNIIPECIDMGGIIGGETSSTSTTSIYLVRDKNNFSSEGIAYVITPNIVFNKPALITINYSYYENKNNLATYKYPENMILSKCENTQVLNNISKEIDPDGGIINIKDKIKLDIPQGALNKTITIEIKEYNLADCDRNKLIELSKKQKSNDKNIYIKALLIAASIAIISWIIFYREKFPKIKKHKRKK